MSIGKSCFSGHFMTSAMPFWDCSSLIQLVSVPQMSEQGVHIAPKHCHQEPRLLISGDTHALTHSETSEPDYWEFHVYILSAAVVMSERSKGAAVPLMRKCSLGVSAPTGGTAFHPARNLTNFLQTCLPPWNMCCIHGGIIPTSATSGKTRVLYTRLTPEQSGDGRGLWTRFPKPVMIFHPCTQQTFQTLICHLSHAAAIWAFV